MPPAVDGGMAGWEGGVGGLWVEWGEVMDREGKGTEALCIRLPLTPPHQFFSPTTTAPILYKAPPPSSENIHYCTLFARRLSWQDFPSSLLLQGIDPG